TAAHGASTVQTVTKVATTTLGSPEGAVRSPPTIIVSSGLSTLPLSLSVRGPTQHRSYGAPGQAAAAGPIPLGPPTPNLAAGKTSRSSAAPNPGLPRLPIPGFVSAAASGAAGGGTLLIFGSLLLALLLVTPNVGRRLRPALALGLSPADLAARERPG